MKKKPILKNATPQGLFLLIASLLFVVACAESNSPTPTVVFTEQPLQLGCDTLERENRDALENQIGVNSSEEDSFIFTLVNCNGSIVGESRILMDENSSLNAGLVFVTNVSEPIDYQFFAFVDDVDVTDIVIGEDKIFQTSTGVATTVALELSHLNKEAYRLTLVGVDKLSAQNRSNLYNSFAINYDVVSTSDENIPSGMISTVEGEYTDFDPNPYYIAYTPDSDSKEKVDLWIGSLYAENEAGLYMIDTKKNRPVEFECGKDNNGMVLFLPSAVDQSTVLRCSIPLYDDSLENIVVLLIPDFFAPPGNILPLFTTLVAKNDLQ